MPSDVYESILARLEGKNVLCAVDATRDLLVNVLKYKPFLIKPNNHELGEIFGRVLTTDEEIRECAEKLQQQGARNVLVSMAGDGAMLLDENGGCHRLAAYKGKVKNSVGAGDSMVAGFLGRLSGQRRLRPCTACGQCRGQRHRLLGCAGHPKRDRGSFEPGISVHRGTQNRTPANRSYPPEKE